MPIRAENRDRYPPDWPAIATGVKEAAGWACVGSPAFPDCRAKHGEPHPVTGSKVIITVAHLDHTPENVDPANLRAWCQRCHNTYDAPNRAKGIAARRRAALAIPDLFDPCPAPGEGFPDEDRGDLGDGEFE
jgi:5-methylcytosine-specific restriction endonuclease McrA